MLFFDIETVARPGTEAFLKPARNLKDPVKIAADLEEKRQKLALNINFADIVALGVAEDDKDIVVWQCRADVNRRWALTQFWDLWCKHATRVGFNSLKYDIPILIRQSQLLNVPFPQDISVNRYRADSLDLMNVLTFQGEIDALSLVNYCKLFGREETAEDGTGAEVAQWVAANEWAKVVAHCTEDVERTRWLARRLGLVS